MEFPKVLGFSVQIEKPFSNDRYYARKLKNEMTGMYSYQINDATGDFLGKIHVPHDKPFDELLDMLRGSAHSLAKLKGFRMPPYDN